MFQERLKKLRKELTLVKLADFYEVSIDYLVGRTDNRLLNSTSVEASIFESLPSEASEEVKPYWNFSG